MKLHDRVRIIFGAFFCLALLLCFVVIDEANGGEIPPDVMAKLRAQIMADQAAIAETIRVPDVSGFPEHIQRRCLSCHEDQAAMLKSSNGVLTDEELFQHALFARNITFLKPAGVVYILIAPTHGVDFVKDPNEICILWQVDYPSVKIRYVFQGTAAGERLTHECTYVRES